MLLATAARLVKARGKSAKFVPVQSAFGEPRPCLFSLLQQFPIDLNQDGFRGPGEALWH
jgi:hypothetical protein